MRGADVLLPFVAALGVRGLVGIGIPVLAVVGIFVLDIRGAALRSIGCIG